MQRPRIHSSEPLRPGTTQALTVAAAAHVTRVLRLTAGDPIILFDGSGMDYDAVIRVAARSGVSVDIQGAQPVARESPLTVTLLQGISRGPRMDAVMQKATELGVTAIQPVLADRTVVRLDAERGVSRLAHWQRIVISACEQCGRSVLPEVRPACPLDVAVDMVEPGTVCLSLDPQGDADLSSLPGAGARVALAIGPEGGFTTAEIATLVNAGFRGLRLGPRILRTETAPIAALAILQFMAGDFGRR